MTRTTARRPALAVERLDPRLAPANVTSLANTLNIALDNANEQITITRAGGAVQFTSTNAFSGTAPAGFSINGNVLTGTDGGGNLITNINITDSTSGTSVVFSTMDSAFNYALSVNLAQPGSGNIRFNASETFAFMLSASTADGNITSGLAATLHFEGPTSLSSSTRNVILLGQMTTDAIVPLMLSANGTGVEQRVQAGNSQNVFAGPVTIQAGEGGATVYTDSNLVLGGTSIFGPAPGTIGSFVLEASGNITDDVGGSVTFNGSELDLHSSGGSITLDSLSNQFGGGGFVNVDIDQAGLNATLVSDNGINLGDVTVPGQLNVTTNNGMIADFGADHSIHVVEASTFTVNGTADISLVEGAHRFNGSVTIAQGGGGNLVNVALRNTLATAVFPIFTGVSLNSGAINDLTLVFDNAGVSLPALTLAGDLGITAGGNIGQSTAFNVNGDVAFTVIGDHGINLGRDNFTGGTAAFDAAHSTQLITFKTLDPLTLDTSNFGRGNVSLTGQTISQNGAVTQQPHGGTLTLTDLPTGATIDLGSEANVLTGPVVFAGSGVNDVSIRTANPLARMADFTVPNAVTDLNVMFDNAPLILGSALPTALANFTAMGAGIFQSAALTLAAVNIAFDAGPNPILLANTANTFNNVSLSNTGASAVTLIANTSVNIVGATVGSGRLLIQANGDITQSGAILQESSASRATFVVLQNNNITLDNTTNDFSGPVYVTAKDSQVKLRDLNVLQLGNVTTQGDLTIIQAAQVTQATGTSLNISRLTITVGGSIVLDNQPNFVAGDISLTAVEGIILRIAGAASLGNVSGSAFTLTSGAVTQLGGTSIVVSGATTIDAGTNAVTLTATGNNFGTLSLTSLGATTAQVLETSGLTLDKVRLGTGGLTVITDGAITETSNGAITQSAAGGLLIFTAGAASLLSLDSAGNDFTGKVNVTQADDVTFRNRGRLDFTLTTTLSGDVDLTAGGTIDLSGVDLSSSVSTFSASARQTTVTTNIIAADGGISFAGATNLAAGVLLTFQAQDTGDITFDGDVTTTGDLLLSAVDGDVVFTRGTWSQGAHDLTITAPNGGMQVGTLVPTDPEARFITTGGTVDLTNSQGMVVNAAGVIQVGTNATAAETATFDIGTGTLDFDGGALQVGLGATPDKLVIKGSGLVDLGGNESGSRLLATGLAPASPATVLTLDPTSTAVILANFANAPGQINTPFFTGQDIAQAAYTGESVTIASAGTASTTGSVILYTADGDKVTVKSSGGAAAGLVAVEDAAGGIIVAVRNNPVAWTLTITTTIGGGDGLTQLDGLGVNGAGAITVVAPTVNLAGGVRADGALTALTMRDVGVDAQGHESSVRAGGATTSITTLAARNVIGLIVDVAGTLNFKALNVDVPDFGQTSENHFTAQRFGTITVSGSTAAHLSGVLYADLTSRLNPTGMALTSGTVAGDMGGNWNLYGAVGTVKTFSASDWSLGISGSQATALGTGVTSVTSLSLGIAEDAFIEASGAVGAVTAAEWDTGSLRAALIGTVAVTGGTVTSPTAGIISSSGDLVDVSIQATAANATGMALTSLTVAGNWYASAGVPTLTVENGSVGTITVGRTLSQATLLVRMVGTTAGRLGSLKAGAIANVTVDARSIGSIAAVGQAAGNIIGNISTLTVTVRGDTGGFAPVAVGTVSAQRQISNLTLTARTGNVTSITAGRNLQSSTITLGDQITGTLGTIQAANWSNVNVTAKAIGTLKAVSVAYAGPDTGATTGDMSGGQVRAFGEFGFGADIGTFSVAGTLGDPSPVAIYSALGIGTFSVGRLVTGSNTQVIADGPNAKIGTLTVGSWDSATLSATSLGTVKITGFASLESVTPLTRGQINNAAWVIGTTGPTAISSLAVQGAIADSSIRALSSIGSLSAGRIDTFTVISAVAPLDTGAGTSGRIGSLTLGSVDAISMFPAVIRATSFGTIAVPGSALLGTSGDVSGLALSARGMVAGSSITSLTVSGSYMDNVGLIADGAIGTFTVAGSVADNGTIGVGVDPVAAVNNVVVALPAVKVGEWRNTDLFARSIGTFTIAGNATLGAAGGMTAGYVQVFGSNGAVAPVALGTFTAVGAVRDSAIDVLAGNVTSFTASAFLGSDLLIGALLGREGTLDGAPTFTGTFGIGNFKTTAPFAGSTTPLDQQMRSASFADSNVVAARLGTVTLSGVNPDVSNDVLDMLFASENFGLAFKLGPTGSPGKVFTNGSVVPLPPGTGVLPKFRYKGF